MSENEDKFEIRWIQRSRQPAQNPANPAYPDGVDAIIGYPGRPSCKISVPYPAVSGLGMWSLKCQSCDLHVFITAAGRADDPRTVTVNCLRPKQA